VAPPQPALYSGVPVPPENSNSFTGRGLAVRIALAPAASQQRTRDRRGASNNLNA
jgi:hypothetical protein